MAASLCYVNSGFRNSLVLHTDVQQKPEKVNSIINNFPRKKLLSYFTSLLVACLFILNVSAQKPINENPSVSLLNSSAFPQSFIGNWKGKLQWMVAGKPTQTFTMQLSIQPADSVGQYTWQIRYGDSSADNRPYLLKPVDTAKGHWVIDERDGILLDSYVHGNSIHGAFTVQGNTIVDNYRVEGNQLFVEFFTIKLANKKTSGKGTPETPFVESYQIGSYQAGTLLRAK